MSNKKSAVSFLKMASGGNVREAYEKFIAPTFIHHNQYFKGDRESLIAGMEEACKTSPNKSIDVKHVYEDGDTVITHSLVNRQTSNEQDVAVVHIFRFEKGLVAELWDIGQMISRDSPNANGMF